MLGDTRASEKRHMLGLSPTIHREPLITPTIGISSSFMATFVHLVTLNGPSNPQTQ